MTKLSFRKVSLTKFHLRLSSEILPPFCSGGKWVKKSSWIENFYFTEFHISYYECQRGIRKLLLFCSWSLTYLLWPGDPIWRRWTRSIFVQAMACRHFGANPLLYPILNYCQLDHQEHTSVKFQSIWLNKLSRNCIFKCRLQNVNCVQIWMCLNVFDGKVVSLTVFNHQWGYWCSSLSQPSTHSSDRNSITSFIIDMICLPVWHFAHNWLTA